jgi:hypothetical protein
LPQLQGLDIGAMLGRTAYGSTQPQAWGGPPGPQAQPQQQGQGQAQQPITINIGGAQQPQQQPAIPESFIPRPAFPGAFPQASGPPIAPQFTPASPGAGGFPGAVPGAPTAPPQFTPATGNVYEQNPYEQALAAFRNARRPTFPSAFPGSPTAPAQFTPIWPAYTPSF